MAAGWRISGSWVPSFWFVAMISVYYEVIDSHLLKAPNNWDYFERCGFNAISLLEKNARWESAIGLAKKLSAFPSPRAKEAAERARRLSLEHMVWED